jgi:hypothetical protein
VLRDRHTIEYVMVVRWEFSERAMSQLINALTCFLQRYNKLGCNVGLTSLRPICALTARL